MNIWKEAQLRKAQYNTRRHFLQKCISGIGALALGSFLDQSLLHGEPIKTASNALPHFTPKAKHIIFLHMAGAPSQLELFDYKPLLQRLDGQDCPPSLMEGKRFAFIRGIPKMLGPQSTF